MQKEILLDMLAQNQITCSAAFTNITNENAHLCLNEKTASAGFIYRHIGEMMNMFGLFFGIPTEVQNTTMGTTDEGQGQDVAQSHLLIQKGFDMLRSYIENSTDNSWLDPVDTPFFGTISRARLFSHMLFHNSHHAGQIVLTLIKGR